MDCSGLTSVTIPNSVERIEYETFFRCKGLISVTIPNSVERIESNAFRSCESLEKIIVPYGTKDRFVAMLDKESARLIVEESVMN